VIAAWGGYRRGMTGHADDYDITESDQNVEGELGISSERRGHTGPGQDAPTGVRDTSEGGRHAHDEDAPPEQSPGAEETNPKGLEPKAGYPSLDPRSRG
jgi:hypothetical protein